MSRSVCLFCSAAESLPAPAQQLAAEFGAASAAHGLRLVYGGSSRGLMGVAARAAAAAGGDVLGIMPRRLIRPERAAENVGTLVIVESLAERKQRMTEAADLFVALPGGIGTLNELIEMLTLNDLGLQLIIASSASNSRQICMSIRHTVPASRDTPPELSIWLRATGSGFRKTFWCHTEGS